VKLCRQTSGVADAAEPDVEAFRADIFFGDREADFARVVARRLLRVVETEGEERRFCKFIGRIDKIVPVEVFLPGIGLLHYFVLLLQEIRKQAVRF